MSNFNTPLDPSVANPNFNITSTTDDIFIPISDILGGFGNAIAIVFFILPFLMMLDLIKTKEISKVPWLMFIFTILNCEFWTLYGLKIQAWPIYVCNGIGIITNHIYLIIFFFYLESADLFKKFLFTFLLIFTFITTFTICFIFVDNTRLLGMIGCLMNILMFASPLQKLSVVYQKKDNSFIPIHISLCLTLNCIVWIAYGASKGMDWFIMTPNLFGFILCLLQVVLWFKFRKIEKTLDFKEENVSGGSDEELNKKSDKKVIEFKKVELHFENEI